MIIFYHKDTHGKTSFSSAHRRCTCSTVQTCLSSFYCFSMTHPDDKSMTKIVGNVHVPVTSKHYTSATTDNGADGAPMSGEPPLLRQPLSIEQAVKYRWSSANAMASPLSRSMRRK